MKEKFVVCGVPCELFSNGAAKARAAVVIVPSSAGVCDIRERRYAAHFSELGIPALVVDCLAARGLSQCMTDQFSLPVEEMMDDAWQAAGWIRSALHVGPVGIFGVSKGGTVCLRTAMPALGRRPEKMPAFAFHAAVVPSCVAMPLDARTNGSPVLVIAGGADDYTGSEQAALLVQRMTSAGADAEFHLMEGAHHAWELGGPPKFYPEAQTFRDCSFFIDDDDTLIDAKSGRRTSRRDFPSVLRSFMKLGAHAGGGSGDLMARTFEILDGFLARAVPEVDA